VNAHIVKPPRPFNYPCHICGIVGDNQPTIPSLEKMQIVFKDKGGKFVESKLITEVKVTIALVNMVDVHFAATQNKAIEEHVFKY
jgi:hypothetical protein